MDIRQAIAIAKEKTISCGECQHFDRALRSCAKARDVTMKYGGSNLRQWLDNPDQPNQCYDFFEADEVVGTVPESDPMQPGYATTKSIVFLFAEEGWVKAKKTGKLLAMPIQQAVEKGIIGSDLVVNTLEGDVTAQPEQFLSKGVMDELWPQDKTDIDKKYNPTGETTAEGFEVFTPNDSPPVDASQQKEGFTVNTSWGEKLTGKPDDWLMRSPDNHDDQWLVANDVFEASYQIM